MGQRVGKEEEDTLGFGQLEDNSALSFASFSVDGSRLSRDALQRFLTAHLEWREHKTGVRRELLCMQRVRDLQQLAEEQLERYMTHDENNGLSRAISAQDALKQAVTEASREDFGAVMTFVSVAIMYLGDEDCTNSISLEEFQAVIRMISKPD